MGRFVPTPQEIREALPGVLRVVLPLALLAEILWYLELRSGVAFFVDIFIAGVLALLLGNIWPVPKEYEPGLAFCTKWLLKVGIIIYGLKFTYTYLFQTGWQNLVLVLAAVALGISVSAAVGRLLGLSAPTAALIGNGTAICGVATIMATAPAIKAKSEETAIALGTILLWGTVGLLFYPLLAAIYHVGPAVFGSWTGASIHDLPHIIAVATQGGGPAALSAALFVKMIRIAFIVVCVLFMTVYFAFQGHPKDGAGVGTLSSRRAVAQALGAFPLFVLGFFAVVVINTVTQVPPAIAGPLATWPASVFPTTLAGFLLTMAIIGICAKVTRSAVLTAGPKALLTGLAAWVVQSGIVLALAASIIG